MLNTPKQPSMDISQPTKGCQVQFSKILNNCKCTNFLVISLSPIIPHAQLLMINCLSSSVLLHGYSSGCYIYLNRDKPNPIFEF